MGQPLERPDQPVFANSRSDRVAAVRALAGRSARSKAGGRFLAGGPQAAREAAAAGAVRDLWVTP
ncbi:MAG: hypothetical protein LBT54_03680, partial [Bifidobacteriaceae bacterium]|nr:hypothetical protein [Bifidobacteriaceae bacterium]